MQSITVIEPEHQPIADVMTLTTYAIIDNTGYLLIPGVPSSLPLSPPESTKESAPVTSYISSSRSIKIR